MPTTPRLHAPDPEKGHEDAKDFAFQDAHGQRESLLRHKSNDDHTWTALPEVSRKYCYRTFSDQPHYSPPGASDVPCGSVRRPSKFIDHTNLEALSQLTISPNNSPLSSKMVPGSMNEFGDLHSQQHRSSKRRASFSPALVEPIVDGDKSSNNRSSVRIAEDEDSEEKDGNQANIDRSEIERNSNGSEEPHSLKPELWNIDGTEMDLNAKYKIGGQLWYLQDRALGAIKDGTSIPGEAMTEYAKTREKDRREDEAKEPWELHQNEKKEDPPPSVATKKVVGLSTANRRGSFTLVPDDHDFQKLGGWSPRERGTSFTNKELDDSNHGKEDDEGEAEEVPPPPKFTPPPLVTESSARDQALDSMHNPFGRYVHDDTLTIDPHASTPSPSRTHKRKWRKVGKTTVRTSSGRLLEIKGTGAAKRNSKIRKGFKKTAMNAVLAVKMMATDAIKVDISRYAVFIPDIISRDIACGGNRFTNRVLSKKSSHSDFTAAVLFVDISGFTKLTEQLNKTGIHGAEALCTHINAIYTKMMTEFKRWGGDCVKFSGDALLVMFEVYEEERMREIHLSSNDSKAVEEEEDVKYKNFQGMSLTLEDACRRAVACSTILHDVIATHPEVNGVKLKLHAGVGCGRATGHVIGGVLGRWEFILSGEGVNQIKDAEPAAGPGETVISPQVWKHVSDYFEGEVLGQPYEGFVKVNPLKTPDDYDSHVPTSRDELTLKPKHIVFMPTYLPNAVIMNLKAGVCDSTSQAEMRDLTTMFISLPNLPLEDRVVVQSAIVAIQEATYQLEGSVNKVVVDDKGALVLNVFGLPPVVHSDDPKRAVAAAFLMRHHLHDMGLQCKIGIASARVFCGIVGAESRKEYTVMGDGVNLAARLMANAQEYEILCDEASFNQCDGQIRFKVKAPIKLKGKENMYNVYRPTSFIPVKGPEHFALGRGKELVELEAMVEILAHDMSNVIVITGKPGMGKHTIATYLDDFCERSDLINIRSGRGENMYMDGEVQAKTLFTAWRKIFIESISILHGERTKNEGGSPSKERLTVMGLSNSANLADVIEFDLVKELHTFMGEEDGIDVNLLSLMFPELLEKDSNSRATKSLENAAMGGSTKWFHLGEDANDNGKSHDEDSVVEETDNSSFILDPKAHARIHSEEKKLKKYLKKYFLKFCKRHPCLLTFENSYGMSSSGMAPSSWTLFHELRKDFHTVRENVVKALETMESNHDDLEEEEGKSIDYDPENMFDPHDHDLCPKFCIITNSMGRPGVEFLEAIDAAKDYDTYLELEAMHDSDVELLLKEKLNAPKMIEPKLLDFVSDMSEGNPRLICELAHSISESKACEIKGGICKIRPGHTTHEINLNSKLRHMVLQEFSTLALHEQLIAKMASVYTKEFSSGMLANHVEQHQKDHEDHPINLKRCIGRLLASEVFIQCPLPPWMAKTDKTALSALRFRSKLMQKAVSELLLESHMTSVARSVSSVQQARRISAFWLQRAVDHERGTGNEKQNECVVEFLEHVPKARKMSIDADDLMEAMGELKRLGTGSSLSPKNEGSEAEEEGGEDNVPGSLPKTFTKQASGRKRDRFKSDFDGTAEGEEGEEEEQKSPTVEKKKVITRNESFTGSLLMDAAESKEDEKGLEGKEEEGKYTTDTEAKKVMARSESFTGSLLMDAAETKDD
ncbi:hypothetical protein TrVE_jg2716 [Triparma verrucosa]|uniref:Guanylate cyclase domain-containing protein n=1 Tax=Triparma verrucosa TaxID=1606542 RepID=A0A9W7FKE0_9STRA|nr:hypothetical protein TrVE_jg2716 [Triparma verrucosa]